MQVKKLLFAMSLLVAASSRVHAQWAGKLDLTSLPAIGIWQSLDSTDQAIGVSKRVFHVDKGEQALVNVGLFAGVSKPILTEPSTAPRTLGGATVAVPGSTLDWALGTHMGDKWVPALKTGVLVAWDVTRFNAVHAAPAFVGAGAQYLFGGGAQ